MLIVSCIGEREKWKPSLYHSYCTKSIKTYNNENEVGGSSILEFSPISWETGCHKNIFLRSTADLTISQTRIYRTTLQCPNILPYSTVLVLYGTVAYNMVLEFKRVQ